MLVEDFDVFCASKDLKCKWPVSNKTRIKIEERVFDICSVQRRNLVTFVKINSRRLTKDDDDDDGCRRIRSKIKL